jgi:eukaryotic-like serine/threonine-protein kinase
MSRRFISTPDLLKVYWLVLGIHISKQGGIATWIAFSWNRASELAGLGLPWRYTGVNMRTHIGHYEIISELGRGGMGVVYKGYEPALTRYVAIKELSPALAHDQTLVERFLREARSMASLNDPHIIQIFLIGQDNNQPFFVMEFVDGESLSAIIKREGRLQVGDALKILHQSAQGLSVAHERGVIHRDIKPGNLMLNQRGQIKIADFGIALANHDFNSKLTGTGEFVGTPGYLSPEVCLGKAVDQRSDIFALGIVLFEMLTGRTPFSDESPLKLMLDVVQSQIPDVRELNADVDTDIAAILSRMLEKEPSARYQDTEALIADLEKHPLVKQGGPLKLKTLPPSGPAATLIGMATPITPGIMRGPTPPPNVSSAAIVNASANLNPVAVAPDNTRPGITLTAPPALPAKSSALKWLAFAAILGLLAVGGAAWGLRSIFTSGTTGEDTIASNSIVADSIIEPSSDTPLATGNNTLPTAPDTDTTASAQTTSIETDSTNDNANTQADPPSPDGSTNNARNSVLPVRDPPPEKIADNIPDNQDNDTQTNAGSGGGHTFAVVTNGDPALMIPAQQMIEDKLSEAGFQSVGSKRADFIIRVSAEIIGNQDISFYGQNAVLTTAYLSIKPVGRGGRALGSGFRQKIDYTPLNAEDKVQQAIEEHMDRVVSNVKN